MQTMVLLNNFKKTKLPLAINNKLFPLIIFSGVIICYYIFNLNNPLKLTDKHEQFPELQLREVPSEKIITAPESEGLYVIKFFAPTCSPCKKDQKFWRALKQKYPDLHVKGVSIRGTNSEIQKFNIATGEIFNSLYLDIYNHGGSKLGVGNVPQIYVVYKNHILMSYNGCIKSDKLKNKLERICDFYF
jgi:thiol-disulfide isomerase/thioredoxin